MSEIRPEVRNIVSRYLDLRNAKCSSNGHYSPALFPSKSGQNGGYLTSNGVRKIKDRVEKDLKIRFDLRMCRRTFGQRYMDQGLPLESTSLLMGHSSTKTTEGFYSRRKLEFAIKDALSTWETAKSGQ